MRIKTANLTGEQLDWAVAKCVPATSTIEMLDLCIYNGYSPSTNWAQGGPIIEREVIGHDRVPTLAHTPREFCAWMYRDAEATKRTARSYGPTPLIAAMRCYCCSKLGEEVEIPKELK